MKSMVIDSSVLGGQGSIGSVSLSAGNPAPGVGPTSGDVGVPDVTVSFTNPGDGNNAEANEPLPGHLEQGGPAPIATPAPSAAMTDGGPSNEPVSQYSTIGPVPKG